MDDVQRLKTLRIVAAVLHADMDGRATRKQVMRLQITFKGYVGDRDERLQVLGVVLGREIASFNEISFGEAKAMLDEPYLGSIIEYARTQLGYY